ISALDRPEIDFAVELLFPQATLESSVRPNGFGPGIPPVGLAGSTRSDSGVAPLPSFGLVWRPEESPWTYGLGVFVVGGFSANYPGDLHNPVLSPPTPAGIGLGPIYADMLTLQFAPAVALRVTDRLSVGAGPTLDLATLRFDPAVVAPPDDANGDGFPSYASATHTRAVWGAGFQV